jgi:hypothetical protein
MGPALAGSAQLLIILAAGEALPMSQGIACGLILAMSRHKVLAIASLVEALAVVVLGLLLARGGLMWICIVVAVCGTASRGVVPMLYACRVLRLSLRQYVLHAMLPPVAIAIAPTIALAVLIRRRPPESWLEFLLYGSTFCIAFAGSFALTLRREWRPLPTEPLAASPILAASGLIE